MLRLKKNDAGAKCLERLLLKDPDNWTGTLSLAGVYQRMFQWEKAEAVILTALQHSPANVKTLSNLANIYRQTKRSDEAIVQYKKAIDLAPSDAQPRTALADLYQELGKLKEAIAAYGGALKHDSVHVPAYLGIANSYHKGGASDRALTYRFNVLGVDLERL